MQINNAGHSHTVSFVRRPRWFLCDSSLEMGVTACLPSLFDIPPECLPSAAFNDVKCRWTKTLSQITRWGGKYTIKLLSWRNGAMFYLERTVKVKCWWHVKQYFFPGLFGKMTSILFLSLVLNRTVQLLMHCIYPFLNNLCCKNFVIYLVFWGHKFFFLLNPKCVMNLQVSCQSLPWKESTVRILKNLWNICRFFS